METVYSVIYADPPWSFKTYSGKGLGRSAEAWYDCLTLDEICALPIENLAEENCVLLMWTTDPFLRESFRVIDAWGFTYKTVGFYWIKSPTSWFGTGYWTRANPEQCLLATRGQPKRTNADVPKLIVAPRREHSRKPDEIYERIERLCVGPYIEIFARQRREGWNALGDETDIGPRTERKWRSRGGPRTTEIPNLGIKLKL